MIFYNFNYRGPFEYDKFILNTMQFCNEVADIKRKMVRSESEGINKQKDKVDALFQDVINNSSSESLMFMDLLTE